MSPEDNEHPETEESPTENGPGEPTEETADENPQANEAVRETGEATEPEPDPPTPEEEIARWKDQALRSRADLENYRKRVARDQADSRRFANADLLRGLLPILDNFNMGLDEARKEGEGSMLYRGMEMVAKQLADFLENEGVEVVETEGVDFDPNLHDAVAQEPDPEVAEGRILRCTRRGYQLKERLLRPASVVVSAGPATESAEDAGESPA